MGFIESYKRLEQLCGDLLGDDRRVSAYIDEMITPPDGSFLVRGWSSDLKQLKHCRWLRNKIVHEPGCSESSMCSADDTQWLDDFYSRILNRRDPLALYRQASKSRAARELSKSHNIPQQAACSGTQRSDGRRKASNEPEWDVILLIVLLIAAAVFVVSRVV